MLMIASCMLPCAQLSNKIGKSHTEGASSTAHGIQTSNLVTLHAPPMGSQTGPPIPQPRQQERAASLRKVTILALLLFRWHGYYFLFHIRHLERQCGRLAEFEYSVVLSSLLKVSNGLDASTCSVGVIPLNLFPP